MRSAGSSTASASSSASSSAACVISTSTAEVAGEHLDGLVAEGLGDRRHLAVAHQGLDDVGASRTPSSCDTSLTVAPEGTLTTPVGTTGSGLRLFLALRPAPPPAALPAAALRAAATRRAGVDDDAPATARLAAARTPRRRTGDRRVRLLDGLLVDRHLAVDDLDAGALEVGENVVDARPALAGDVADLTALRHSPHRLSLLAGRREAAAQIWVWRDGGAKGAGEGPALAAPPRGTPGRDTGTLPCPAPPRRAPAPRARAQRAIVSSPLADVCAGTRRRSARAAFRLHAPAVSPSSAAASPGGRLFGRHARLDRGRLRRVRGVGLRLDRRHVVGMDAAVPRARLGLVRTALAVARDRRALAAHLVVVAVLGMRLGLGLLLLALDVDAPAGQLARETRVLALLADGQRELVVGHDDGGRLVLVVDDDLAHARRRERLGDEARRRRRCTG